MTEFCSIDRVTYPLPCQQSYMRWSAHSLPPLDTVSQGRRESGLQQMHPEALQNVRKRAFEMLDAGMNCVEIARKLSAHPQTIRKWKKHRETFGEELSVIGLKRGPKKLRPEALKRDAVTATARRTARRIERNPAGRPLFLRFANGDAERGFRVTRLLI